MHWTTVDKKQIPINELTHQHLSNIYWYHLIFVYKPDFFIRPYMRKAMNDKVVFAKGEIDLRFNGNILPWEPVFSFEKEWLEEMEGLDIVDGRILFLGREIGKLPPVLKELKVLG